MNAKAQLLALSVWVTILGCHIGETPRQGPEAELPRFRLVLDASKGVVMEFVRLPEGAIRVGSADEQPARISSDVWIQTTEVTQAQWEAVMGGGRCFCGECPHPPPADLARHNLNYDACRSFLSTVNKTFGAALGSRKATLPSEAEWEYACRAGTTTRWHFGDDESKLVDYAWFEVNSGRAVQSVAGKMPNPWGLYDLYGNVEEWCSDASGEGNRAIRGGTCDSNSSGVASARRHWRDPI
jgi:formylglycine-generating enzyme required for sulfatase activity